MKTYTVIEAPVRLPVNCRVKLTGEQASARMHCLEAVEGSDDEFTVLTPIEFKVGETFGCDGEMGRGFLEAVAEKGDKVSAGEKRRETKKPKGDKGEAEKPAPEKASA